MPEYISVVHHDPTSGFTMSFPDFPNIVARTTSADAVAAMAGEALELHLEGLVKDGLPLPEASTIEAVRAHPSIAGAVAVMYFPR
jgi:predicted RNase H-like HicB family nuclease